MISRRYPLQILPLTVAAFAFTAAAVAGQSTEPAGESPVLAHNHQGPNGDRYQALEEAIRCDCGCGLNLHVCQDQMQCGTSPAWSNRIRQALESGETDEEILAGFVGDFGPTILANPQFEGVGWLAYIMPMLGILGGLSLLGLVLRRGTRGPQVVPSQVVVSNDDEKRIREAMSRLDLWD